MDLREKLKNHLQGMNSLMKQEITNIIIRVMVGYNLQIFKIIIFNFTNSLNTNFFDYLNQPFFIFLNLKYLYF